MNRYLIWLFFIAIPSIGSSQVRIRTTDHISQEQIRIEQLTGRAAANSVVSRVYPYTGDRIYTGDFVGRISDIANIPPETFYVYPPKVEDESQLGYVLVYVTNTLLGQFYQAVCAVFIDGIYDGVPRFYFDTNLDNDFREENPMIIAESHYGERIRLQPQQSPVFFKIEVGDFLESKKGSDYVAMQTFSLNKKEVTDNSTLVNYRRFVSTVLHPSGLSLFLEGGSGGGGQNRYSIEQTDDPSFYYTYMHKFRSQSLTLGLLYNYKHFFVSAFYMIEGLQAQHGRRTTHDGSFSITDHGYTHFFPKSKGYYGANLGYDFRINHNMFFSPFVGATKFDYLDNRRNFNETQLKRMTVHLGGRLAFPLFSGNTVAYVNAYYSRQFMEHANIQIGAVAPVRQIDLQHRDMFHQQIIVSLGIQQKITNIVR
jgi:hypothetical protein